MTSILVASFSQGLKVRSVKTRVSPKVGSSAGATCSCSSLTAAKSGSPNSRCGATRTVGIFPSAGIPLKSGGPV